MHRHGSYRRYKQPKGDDRFWMQRYLCLPCGHTLLYHKKPNTAAEMGNTAAAKHVHMRILAASCFRNSVCIGFVVTSATNC